MMIKSRIAEIRISLGMTQEQLGRFMDVHALTISKWERGVLSPSPYKEQLLHCLEMARNRNPEIGSIIVDTILGRGVMRSLYEVLKTAYKDKDMP